MISDVPAVREDACRLVLMTIPGSNDHSAML